MCQDEIKRRVGLERSAMMRLSDLQKESNIKPAQKPEQRTRQFVFFFLTYGCEAWTTRKIDIKKIDSFDIWCLRRLSIISWMQKRTNMSVTLLKPSSRNNDSCTSSTYYDQIIPWKNQLFWAWAKKQSEQAGLTISKY